MNKSFKTNKISCGVAVIVLIGFFTQSCIGMIEYRKMQLQSRLKNPSILNLRNYESSMPKRQAESLAKGKLIQSEGAEYGYYIIDYKSELDDDQGSEILSGIILGVLTLGVAIFFGVPTDSFDFYLEANLYIFDSNGSLVKKYCDGDHFHQIAGLYYGHDPTPIATTKYSKMYDRIFALATKDADEINAKLMKTGPISEEKEVDARQKIEAFLTSK